MKIAKKILKITGWIIAGLLLMLGLLLLFILTPPGKKTIVNIAENQVNKILNSSLSVGKMSGNFFSHLELYDLLLLSENNDTIAQIPAIRLSYQLKPLLNSEIIVDKVEIKQPHLFLKQYSDSSWNFEYIVKPTPEDTTSSSFNMLVLLKELILTDGQIFIRALDTIIPSQINDIQLLVSGRYETDNFEGSIEKFSFNTQDPDISLKQLALQIKGDQKMIEIPGLVVETKENRITINGLYHFDLQERSFVTIQTDSIILDEFSHFLPDISTKAHPKLSLTAEITGSNISASLELAENENAISLDINGNRLLDALFADSNEIIIPDYELNLHANNIDLAYWLNNTDFQYIINGDFTTIGSGITPESIHATASLHLFNSEVLGYDFQGVDVKAKYDQGNLSASLYGKGDFGEVTLQPVIKNITGKQPEYQLFAQTSHLNPAVLLNDPDFAGAINLVLDVKGAGFNLKTMKLAANLHLSPSLFYGAEIDTIETKLYLDQENITIQHLYIQALQTHIEAVGNYHLTRQSDIQLTAAIENTDKIKDFLAISGIDTMHSSLQLQAHLQGVPDSLTADVDIQTGYTLFNNYHADSLRMKAYISLIENAITVEGNILGRNIFAADLILDTLSVDLQTDLTNYSAKIDIHGDEVDLRLDADARVNDTISATIHELEFAYHDYAWRKCDSTSKLEICDDSYSIENFTLLHKNNNTQQITLNGIIRRNGEQDFSATISRLNIPEILNVLEIKENITGDLNLNLSVSGPAADPQIRGFMDVKNAAFENYRIDSLIGRVIYDNREAKALFSLIPQDSGKVYLTAKIPAQIALDSMQFIVKQNDEDSINAKGFIVDLPLEIIRMFIPVDAVDGVIKSKVEISGTWGEPQINGFLEIPDGNLNIERWGIDYQHITTNINIQPDRISIDTLYIESKNKTLLSKQSGKMAVKGDAIFNKSLLQGELSNANMDIHFNRFKPINHKQYNTELEGNIRLESNRDSVYFSGDISIPETQVFLPALMNLLGESSASPLSKPLLVQELERKGDTLSLISVQKENQEKDSTRSQIAYSFMENLRGDIRIKIPRNMWIKNEEMRIELSGDVDLIKHREFFEIFGNIDIVRGQYELMGKTFLIKSGSVVFQGGEELNPMLNLQATYTFRDPERNKKELALAISGDLNQPQLAFSIEGESISEADAISYIIFGMDIESLSSGQNQALSSGMDAAGIAQSAAASLVSSELTKLFGKLLNVDYIELKSNGSFTDMSLNVGKYITNNIFISYEQHIGASKDENTSNTTFRLEYEILKFLFLELTASPNWKESGGDLIFKFNSK